MDLVCLDMEGVLTPEIWIEFARVSGIPELKRTTRDEPDSAWVFERYRPSSLKSTPCPAPGISWTPSGTGPRR